MFWVGGFIHAQTIVSPSPTTSVKTSLIYVAALTLSLASVAHASVTETFSKTYPLNAQGTVSLQNINGPVEIIGWDKSEVSIEAIKEASDEEGLERIQIKVDATDTRLVIKTEHEKTWKFWGTFQASVRYTLRVPAGATLDKINTVNASISVTGVHGPVNLDTVNGSIHASGLMADARLDSVNGNLTAEFDSLDKAQNVKLESVNGRAEIILPKGASASISTRSVNGSTHVDQAIKLEKSGHLGVTGQIGTGGPTIRLETVNGSVSVREK